MGKYFGTDGFRGRADVTLTGAHAYKIGRFIGYFENGHKNKILIARDTRLSGKMLSDSLSSGIVSSGSDAYDLGISTTPSISYLVRKYNFDFGIMISASHNPYYDNGIKIFNKEGEKLSADIEKLIEDYLDSDKDYIPYALNENIGRHIDGREYLNDYLSFLVSKASPLVSGIKVLLDCANGSSSVFAEKLLSELGIDGSIRNSNYNGININDNCGSTHLEYLKEEVKKGDFDIAFAFDGDADRCLAVDKDGNIIDGDAIMYLNAIHLKKTGKLKDNTIVLTVMSNLGLKKAFDRQGIKYKEVSVGDKYVQAELKKYSYSLGGEQSGHIIFLDDLNTGDGLLTMIKVLNVLSNERKDIKQLLSDLIIYPQLLKNKVVEDKDRVLNDNGFNERIKLNEAKLDGNGRILVRPSGTEPLIRVMCEAKTLNICEEICDDLINYIDRIN